MKKIILVILLSLITVFTAKAEPMEVDDHVNELKIVDQGSCGANCTYELDNKGFLLIKPTDASEKAYIEEKAFYEREDFARAKIEEGVVSIGDYAFERTNLVKIDLPSTLTDIGKYAFSHSELKRIEIPDSITTIQEGVFKYNKLREVVLPKNLKIIGSGAFTANSKLKHITIPDTVTSIGSGAFGLCGLENLKLPESLESMEYEAFWATDIKNLYIPRSLKVINYNVFARIKVSELSIPDSVVFIDNWAFMDVKLSYLIISDTTEVSDGAFERATIGTVYCRGDVETCKENLEDAVPETTVFKSVSELEVKQEAEASTKEEDAAPAQGQEVSSNVSNETVADEKTDDSILDVTIK